MTFSRLPSFLLYGIVLWECLLHLSNVFGLENNAYDTFVRRFSAFEQKCLDACEAGSVWNHQEMEQAISELVADACGYPALWGEGDKASPCELLLLPFFHGKDGRRYQNPVWSGNGVMELMRRRVIPGTLEERQQTLHAFIKMLDNQDYEDEVDSLCRIIVRHLHDDDVWTPANMRSFQRTYYRKAKEFAMVSGQSQFRLRFFLCYYFVNWTLEENRILGEIFLEFGKGLRHFVHSGLKDGFTGMERWGALVLSASCGNGEAFRHLARLMQTAGGDDLDTVRKLFPYLALVRQQQAVDLLVPFLSDRHLQASEGCGFESGDGLAFQAAKALVSMVEGVPVFDVDRFREDDRRRLEQWFQAHHGYRFKTWNLWPQRMAGQRSGMNVKDSGIETPEVLEQRIVRRVSGAIFGY